MSLTSSVGPSGDRPRLNSELERILLVHDEVRETERQRIANIIQYAPSDYRPTRDELVQWLRSGAKS